MAFLMLDADILSAWLTGCVIVGSIYIACRIGKRDGRR